MYSNSKYNNFWEEIIILLESVSAEYAISRAINIGINGECEYDVLYNNESDKIKICFRKIERVFQIENDSIVDDTEVFSRILRNSEVKSLLEPFDDENNPDL